MQGKDQTPQEEAEVQSAERLANVGKQGMGISFSIFPCSLLGFPQAPDRPLCVRSNTPDGVAFPLPTVAHSCTSAQEIRGAVAPRQDCAGDGAVSS